MTSVAGSASAPRPPAASPLQVSLAAAAVLSMLGALALVILEQPTLAVLVLLVLPAVVAIARSPDYVAPAVAFLLYINAPAIANIFHGVPFLIAAAIPLTLAIPIARDVVLRGQRIVIPPSFAFLVLLIVVQFTGALFAIYPNKAVITLLSSAIETVVLYLLIANSIRTPAALKQVIWALVAAGALMGALSAHQQLTRSFDSSYGGFAQVSGNSLGLGVEGGQPRLSGPVGEKNRFAQVMGMLVPIALFQALSAANRRQALLASGGLVLILVGFSLAFSRGAAVGLALMFVIMIFMGVVRLKHVLVGVLGLAAAVAVVPKYAERVGSMFELTGRVVAGGIQNADGATRGRTTEMVASAMVFGDHPIIGVGPGMNRYHYIEYARQVGGKVKADARRSHSLYLGLAAEHGVLGLIAYFGMVFVAFRELRRARRRWASESREVAAIADGLTLALVIYFTTSIFLHASYTRYFWLIMGISAALGSMRMPSRNTDVVRWLVNRLAHPH